MTEVQKAKAIIVVLIGLPAVGKSSLARLITKDAESHGFTSVHIELDELERNQQQQQQFEREAWKEARKQAIQIVNEKLVNEQQQVQPLVLIVDDNSHLRSMRLNFARIASKQHCSFAEIFINPETKEQLQQTKQLNDSREGISKIPTSIIEAMQAVIEQPNPLKYKWESNFIQIQPIWTFDINQQVKLLEDIWKLIRSSLDFGALRLFDSDLYEQQIEKAREINTKSISHQRDLWSRSIVSQIMQNSIEPNKRASFALRLSNLRKEFLSNFDQDEEQFLRNLISIVKSNP